jgi:hypothetical protein
MVGGVRGIGMREKKMAKKVEYRFGRKGLKIHFDYKAVFIRRKKKSKFRSFEGVITFDFPLNKTHPSHVFIRPKKNEVSKFGSFHIDHWVATTLHKKNPLVSSATTYQSWYHLPNWCDRMLP